MDHAHTQRLHIIEYALVFFLLPTACYNNTDVDSPGGGTGADGMAECEGAKETLDALCGDEYDIGDEFWSCVNESSVDCDGVHSCLVEEALCDFVSIGECVGLYLYCSQLECDDVRIHCPDSPYFSPDSPMEGAYDLRAAFGSCASFYVALTPPGGSETSTAMYAGVCLDGSCLTEEQVLEKICGE